MTWKVNTVTGQVIFWKLAGVQFP